MHPLQFIEAVESGDAVPFREGGVVEDVVDEGIEGGAKGHRELANVNEL